MGQPTVPSEEAKRRRRLITLGEVIALAGLAISALALWNSWKGSDDSKPPAVTDAKKAVPLALRGTVVDEGKALHLVPAESGHSLEDLTITARSPAQGTAPFGSDPTLSAAMVETWLPKSEHNSGIGGITVEINARYIEAGESRTATQRYRIAYRWIDGGLFGGKSLRLTSISRL